MMKFLNIFFVSLGVIFFALIIAGAVFFTVDPYNLKPLIHTLWGSESQTEVQDSPDNQQTGGESSLLSEQQKRQLEAIGVDPESVPSEITPEMEACFQQELGEERTAEIKAGASPTATDYFKASNCLE